MPINETKIGEDVLSLLQSIQTNGGKENVKPVDIQKQLADGLAKIIADHIKTITITIAVGTIQVEGTQAAQSNTNEIVLNGAVE